MDNWSFRVWFSFDDIFGDSHFWPTEDGLSSFERHLRMYPRCLFSGIVGRGAGYRMLLIIKDSTSLNKQIKSTVVHDIGRED